MTKVPHNVPFGDHDRARKTPAEIAHRDQTRRQQLVDLLKAWLSGGAKGTKPRKARIGQTTARSKQTRMRASQDRVKRRMTKTIQATRLSRNQNVRSGKR